MHSNSHNLHVFTLTVSKAFRPFILVYTWVANIGNHSALSSCGELLKLCTDLQVFPRLKVCKVVHAGVLTLHGGLFLMEMEIPLIIYQD